MRKIKAKTDDGLIGGRIIGEDSDQVVILFDDNIKTFAFLSDLLTDDYEVDEKVRELIKSKIQEYERSKESEDEPVSENT